MQARVSAPACILIAAMVIRKRRLRPTLLS